MCNVFFSGTLKRYVQCWAGCLDHHAINRCFLFFFRIVGMLEVYLVSIIDVWFEDVYQYLHEVKVHNFIPLLDRC